MMFDFKLIWLWLIYDLKYNFWYGPIHYIKDTPYRIKWWWQRRIRGWDDRDCWSLDVTIAKFIVPRLKHLRDNKMGYPCDLSSEIEWNLILDQMIEAFELAQEDSYFCPENYQQQQDKLDKGLQLFAKYYQNLWD